jgi:hypothetical protein
LDALETEYGVDNAKALTNKLKTNTAFATEAANLVKSYEGLDMGKSAEDKDVIGQVQRYLGELQQQIKANAISTTAEKIGTTKDLATQTKEALGETPDINKYNSAIDTAIDAQNGPLVKELFVKRKEFVSSKPDLVSKGTI